MNTGNETPTKYALVEWGYSTRLASLMVGECPAGEKDVDPRVYDLVQFLEVKMVSPEDMDILARPGIFKELLEVLDVSGEPSRQVFE
jgi:hypothetical protein